MDINLINILTSFICLIFGYLCGSFSFSIIIGKVFYHQDPRKFGSKNAGGTNAGRLWGKKAGLAVILLDMIKTIAPMWIAWAILTYIPFGDKPLMASTLTYYTEANKDYIIQWPVYVLVSLGCFIGHCWPLFDHFKGGKGVTVFCGMLVGSSWLFGIVPALSIYFPILRRTKYVSLTSIIIGLISVVATWVWVILVLCKVIPNGYEWLPMFGPTINCTWHFALVLTINVGIMIAKHHTNISRLVKGEERKITWLKDY